MRRLVLASCLVFAGPACSPVDPASLPPVPEVRTDRFLAGVQSQLGAAYQALQERPVDAAANGQLAMLLQTYKQFNAADVAYRRARLLAPDEFDYAYLHGIVLTALGNPQAAIEAFERALEIEPDYLMTKVRLAELLTDQGEVVRAGALFEEVMTSPAPPAEAWFAHGKFLLDGGNVRQAVASFKETLRRSGDLGVAHYQLGLAYRELGETELAERHLRLAKKHQGYAGDSSDRVLNKLLPLNLSEQPFVHRARVLAENGRFDEAKRFIAMALERNPDSVAAHASMMGMAARDGDFARADWHYEQAVAIEPDNAKVFFNLGMARIAEERYVEARRAFERSIELDDTDARARVQLAILLERDGRTGQAESQLRKALDLDPDNTVAAWLLGELLRDRGEFVASIALLEQAADAGHPMTPHILMALTNTRLQTGQLDEADSALQSLRESRDRFPDVVSDAAVEELATKLAEARRDGAAIDTP